MLTLGEQVESSRITGRRRHDPPIALEQPRRDPGSNQAPPPATARTAAIRSSAELSLSTNPAAPASIAPHSTSSSPNVVSTRTQRGSSMARSWAVADTPSRAGMRMSIRTTSGCRAGSSSTACLPSAHSATTSKPSAGRGSSRGPRGRWPGRRRERPGSSAPPVSHRKLAAHPPAAGCRPGGELAAERRRPLLHADQAVPGPLALGGEDDVTIGPVVSATMATRPFVSSSPSEVCARGAWRAAFASASWVIR